jgi:type II secretion system protein N
VKLFKFLGKKILVVFSAILVFGLILRYFVMPQYLNPYLEKKIAEINSELGTRITVNSLSTHYLGVSAKKIETFVPQIFSVLTVDDLYANISLLSLMSLKPQINLNARLYSGDVNIQTKMEPSTNIFSGNAVFRNIHLPSIPIPLGLQSGLLTINIEEFIFGPLDKPSVKLNFILSDVHKPTPTDAKLDFIKPNLTLYIPEFSKLDAVGEIEITNEEVKINKLKILSSLANIELSGSLIPSSHSAKKHANISGNVKLSEAGTQKLLPLIVPYSDEQLEYDTDSFNFEISGNINKPAVIFTKE